MNTIINREVKIIDLGLIDYQPAWDQQALIFNEILEVKKTNRLLPPDQQHPTANYLLFCEHPHVYTLGKSGDVNHLLAGDSQLAQLRATFISTNRGGDITYHGPGQIIVYPIVDLENFFTDIHQYMRTLEEAVILVLKKFSIAAGRIQGLTGVWLDEGNSTKARKICALGVKTSRWVTMHGLAFNVNPDLSYFNHIVPCGIIDKAVTSLEKELGHSVHMEEVKGLLEKEIINLFQMSPVE